MKQLFLLLLSFYSLNLSGQYQMVQSEKEVNLYLQEASNDFSSSGTYFILAGITSVASAVLLASDEQNQRKIGAYVGAGTLVFATIGGYKLRIGGVKMQKAYERQLFLQGG